MAQTLDTAMQQFTLKGARIRRLTPRECERLQGFPEIENRVIIEVCLDHQKNHAVAENRNHKLLSLVGSAEKSDSEESVKSVESRLNISDPQKDKPVQCDVLINCVENGVEILNQEKCLLSVNTASGQKWLVPPIKIEDFVRLVAGLSLCVEKITQDGKVESLAKEQGSIVQIVGGNYVKLCGSGIKQSAKDAKKNLTTRKALLKSIMSYPFGIESSATNLITLFYCVMDAMSGFIPKQTADTASLKILLQTKLGWTFGQSDSQRYKMIGNAVSVPVIQFIIEKLMKSEKQC